MAAPESAAADAIRRHLRENRPLFPYALRLAFLAALALLATYFVLLAYAYVTDRPLFDDMLRLYALTLLVGREPAMFAVYQPPTPVPLHWMLVFGVIDDLATLLITITWVWVAFERLRRVEWVRNRIVGLEKAALENRRWLRRWGVGGLVAFYWLPGFGSGVLAVCVLGVLSRIDLRRLVPALVVAGVIVAVFWAVALDRTSALLPSGVVEWLPVAVIAIVFGLSVIASLRNRRTAHVLLLEWPPPAGDRLPALAELGIRPHGRITEVDTHLLRDQLGARKLRRGPGHAIAELLLLDGMTPEAAAALEERGVAGIKDLALLEAPLVRAALREAGVEEGGHAESWIREADALAANAGDAWRKKSRARPAAAPV